MTFEFAVHLGNKAIISEISLDIKYFIAHFTSETLFHGMYPSMNYQIGICLKFFITYTTFESQMLLFFLFLIFVFPFSLQGLKEIQFKEKYRTVKIDQKCPWSIFFKRVNMSTMTRHRLPFDSLPNTNGLLSSWSSSGSNPRNSTFAKKRQIVTAKARNNFPNSKSETIK